MESKSLKKLKKRQELKKKLITIAITFGVCIFIWFGHYLLSGNFVAPSLSSGGIFIFTVAYIITRSFMIESRRRKKMEDAFPDFIELMASNLRAGMTVDKALLLSSRKEFHPLDDEILLLGKDIATGKEMSLAMLDMADRTKSEKIKKTVTVVISGLKSGGDLAVLLEETAINMRERGFIEKRAASNVLMYMIFIFFAVGVGAPALFSLSTILVKTLTTILSNLPEMDSSVSSNMAFSLTSINVDVNFIMYYSVIFIVIADIMASLLVGIVNKGDEKEGLKYSIPLIIIGLTVYFGVRYALSGYFASIIGG
jgi:archaeal flagellar protein FlaJ